MEVGWTREELDGLWGDRSLEGEECVEILGPPIAPVRLEEIMDPEESGRISGG